MWSDRVSPERLGELVEKLRTALPAPTSNASTIQKELPIRGSMEQVAELLHAEPGFAWLNAGPDGPCIVSNPIATIEYSDGLATITGPGGRIEINGLGLDILQAALASWGGPHKALLIGSLSYDLASELEDLGAAPPQDFTFPKFYFGLFDSALILRESTWYAIGTDAWRSLSPPELKEIEPRRAFGPIGSGNTLTSRPDAPSFEAAVDRIVKTIHAGDIFQTNLCRRISACLHGVTDWDLLGRLRLINPAEYAAFIRVDDHRSILSISPELFLKVENGVVESSPIKGTRPRGHNADWDRKLSDDLLISEKDRAELAMIVDVVRNDLGRVCETGSVVVEEHSKLMTLPTVHHTVSTVKGRLRKDATAIDLLRAAFPPASISGAPKIEAMRVAMREEKQPRGPCMGAIGWISMDGDMELSVAIRTAFVENNCVRYYAGCGITADSVPHDEFMESRHKAAAFVRALGLESDPNW